MLRIDPERVSPQVVGRMGELVVELELLSRGWLVGNFNSSLTNSAGWDLFAAKPGASVKLRVKAKRPGTECFRWSADPSGRVLHGLSNDDPSDFVAAVTFRPEGGYEAYVVPAAVVEAELAANHLAYVSAPKRDGSARKDSPQRNLYMDDRGPIGHGYLRRWAQYRNAWDALEETVGREPN